MPIIPLLSGRTAFLPMGFFIFVHFELDVAHLVNGSFGVPSDGVRLVGFKTESFLLLNSVPLRNSLTSNFMHEQYYENVPFSIFPSQSNCASESDLINAPAQLFSFLFLAFQLPATLTTNAGSSILLTSR